jgi:hypothetical protein
MTQKGPARSIATLSLGEVNSPLNCTKWTVD